MSRVLLYKNFRLHSRIAQCIFSSMRVTAGRRMSVLFVTCATSFLGHSVSLQWLLLDQRRAIWVLKSFFYYLDNEESSDEDSDILLRSSIRYTTSLVLAIDFRLEEVLSHRGTFSLGVVNLLWHGIHDFNFLVGITSNYTTNTTASPASITVCGHVSPRASTTTASVLTSSATGKVYYPVVKPVLKNYPFSYCYCCRGNRHCYMLCSFTPSLAPLPLPLVLALQQLSILSSIRVGFQWCFTMTKEQLNSLHLFI